MSKIDELIAKLCPNGVEYKKLGQLGEFIRGSGLQKKDITDFDNGFGAIHYGQIYTYYSIHTNKTKSFVASAHSKNLKKAKSGNLVIATTSENDTDVCKAVAWLGKKDIAVSSDACIYRHSLEPKYVAYFFQSEQFQLQKLGNITGTKVRRVSPSCMAKFLIPVPPLEIQREIVKVLDTFTKLEAELEAELEARRRQYHYYRDQLLNFEGRDDVQCMTLGEVTKINTGQKPSNILEVATDFEYINAGTSRSGYCVASNCEGDTVTTPSRGQGGIGYVGYQKKPFWLGPLCYKLQSLDNDILINKYLFYVLQSKNELLLGLKKEGGVPAVNKSDIIKLEIPVPPLEEQTRIVTILDKFDALVNDLSCGLPAEIAARRKQYAYYRDRLLTFKEAQ